MDAWKDAHLEYARLVSQKLDELGVPLEHRSEKELKLECEAKGLLTSGNREIFLRRLVLLAKGEIQPCVSFVPVHFERPPPAPGAYHASLQGMPHFLLQYHVFQACTNECLLNLIRTCKYFYLDALEVLQSRAKELFGPSATVMSVSLLDFLVSRWKTPAHTNKRWPEERLLDVEMTIAERMERKESGDALSCCKRLVELAIERHGSINLCLARRLNERERTETFRDERVGLMKTMHERVAEVRKQLEDLGAPSDFFLVNATHDGMGVYVQGAPGRLNVWNMMSSLRKGWAAEVKKIALGKQLTGSKNLKYLPPYMVKLLQFTDKHVDGQAISTLIPLAEMFSFSADGETARIGHYKVSFAEFEQIFFDLVSSSNELEFYHNASDFDVTKTLKEVNGWEYMLLRVLDLKTRKVTGIYKVRAASYMWLNTEVEAALKVNRLVVMQHGWRWEQFAFVLPEE